VFTGLIETIGTIRSVRRTGHRGRLEVTVVWPDDDIPRTGDSVAVNGACLTVLSPEDGGFAADLSSETLSRTLLGELRPSTPVNLERAVRMGDRLGGHIVQGHVDSIAKIVAIQPEGDFSRWRISLPQPQAPEVAAKGSIALNGVSLTVAALGSDWFEVALIPETLRATALRDLRPGAKVHLETDVLAKYVRRTVECEDNAPPSALQEMFGGGG